MIWGIILFLFGTEIYKFFTNLNLFQLFGYIFLSIGLGIFCGYKCFVETKFSEKFDYGVTTLCLISNFIFIISFSKIQENYVELVMIIMLAINYFLSVSITSWLTLYIISFINNLKNKIDSDSEKTTLLISFFGILISLIAIFK